MKEALISNFRMRKQEKLICVFEYMLPGIIWDEHNVVFISRYKDNVYAYHYIHDDKEETKEIFAIYDFFREQGIHLEETPMNVVPPPFFSRVLFPPEDSGKPFYVAKSANNLMEKLLRLFHSYEPVMLNKNLSFTKEIKTIHQRKCQYHPILLYRATDNSSCEWELDENW